MARVSLMILVTGGAGFIGSNLVARILEAGEGPVVVCDRLGRGEKWRNLAKHDLDALVAPEGLAEFLTERGREVTHVFHLGAVTSTAESDADLIAETNIRLPQALWRWCTQRVVPMLYASSAATYGNGAEGFLDGADPSYLARLRPLNPYGWSKHVFDRWVARQVAEGRDTPPQWVGLKFFNVYGPNEYHKDDMRSVVCKAFPAARAGEPVTLFRSHRPDVPDGGQKRDFVYVKDCVDVMLWLKDREEINGLFNLGSGQARTWLDLMAALHDAVGQRLEVKWIDVPEDLRERYQYFTEADTTRLRKAGYDAPLTGIEEGVRDYVESYLTADDSYR